MTRGSDLKQVQIVNITGDEECVTQHKLLICEINLRTQIRKQNKLPPKRHIWKLQKTEFQEKHKKAVEESINSSTLLSDLHSEADVESIWTAINLVWLMLVTLYADGRKKIVNKKEKHGGGMRQ